MKNIVFVTGLPRSGSTLLCNILAQHKEIGATPSSPLCHIVQSMKKKWSDDPFLLAQLDNNFETVYERLKRSMRAFCDAWTSDTPTKFALDKNRGWLASCELVRELYPNMKMVLCLRDLRSIFGSIERQHRKTLLLDFPDHMDGNIIDNRARVLFDANGIIGSPLVALNNMSDIVDIKKHIYVFRYEDFADYPQEILKDLTKWMGADDFEYDLENIEQKAVESDSYYRFKYPHRVHKKFAVAKTFKESNISPRILDEIINRFRWYYSSYYSDTELPEVNRAKPLQPQAVKVETASESDYKSESETDSQVRQELEEAIDDVLDV